MPRENYYEERAAKIERLEARAAVKAREASSTLARARTMADGIPFGQPILVGHHSEGRDRRYRARIDGTFRKAFATHDEAQSLAARAASAESNRAISSDAPDAVALLREKVAKLEKTREMMRAANKAVRRKDTAAGDAALAAMGYTPAQVAKLRAPDFAGRVGYPDYALSNLGGRLRAAQKRVAQLEAEAAAAPAPGAECAQREVLVGGEVVARVVENTEANRLQLLFPGKPSEAVRTALKSWGFKWSPREGAWQRLLNNAARHAATAVEKMLGGVVS